MVKYNIVTRYFTSLNLTEKVNIPKKKKKEIKESIISRTIFVTFKFQKQVIIVTN